MLGKSRMLTGLYDLVFRELELEGSPEELLKLADLLEAAEESLVVNLGIRRAKTSPSDMELEELRLEVKDEESLLVRHEGTTLQVVGSKESIELLARNIRVLAEETINEPIRSVQNHLHVDCAAYFFIHNESEPLTINVTQE